MGFRGAAQVQHCRMQFTRMHIAQHIHQQVHYQVHLQPPGVLGQAKVGHTTLGGGAIRIDILLRIRKIAVQAQYGGDNSKLEGSQNLI